MKNLVKPYVVAGWVVLGASLGWASLGWAAQDQLEPATVAANAAQLAPAPLDPVPFDPTQFDQAQLENQYEAAVVKLRAAAKEAIRTHALYLHSPAAESADWHEKFGKAAEDGKQAASDLKSVAVEMLQRSDTPSNDIIVIATQALAEAYEGAHYETSYQIAERLAELKPDQAKFQQMQSRAAILTNRFDVAKQFSEASSANVASLPEGEIKLFRELDGLQKNFAEEQKLRAAEAAADDLPRVELETTQGKIVLELFENQSPETVANFIYLIEQNFYDGTYFHHVVKNYVPLTISQTGFLFPGGQKFTRYRIYDEFKDSRHHFRGVVSMSNVDGVPNSASTQFFLTSVPVPFLDGHHAVFGRVLSDTRILDRLQPTFTIDDKGKEEPILDIVPDSIIQARVLRKRDHEYVPRHVEE